MVQVSCGRKGISQSISRTGAHTHTHTHTPTHTRLEEILTCLMQALYSTFTRLASPNGWLKLHATNRTKRVVLPWFFFFQRPLDHEKDILVHCKQGSRVGSAHSCKEHKMGRCLTAQEPMAVHGMGWCSKWRVLRCMFETLIQITYFVAMIEKQIFLYSKNINHQAYLSKLAITTKEEKSYSGTIYLRNSVPRKRKREFLRVQIAHVP